MTSHEQFEMTVLKAVESGSLEMVYSTERRIEKQGRNTFLYYTKDDMTDVNNYIEWAQGVV